MLILMNAGFTFSGEIVVRFGNYLSYGNQKTRNQVSKSFESSSSEKLFHFNCNIWNNYDHLYQ